MKHSFGGPWTQIKLELLERYLAFFNTALQNQPSVSNRFRRIYIDAFAGTGECEIKLSEGVFCTIEGSARIAITTSPPFDELHLIDINAEHVAELKSLISKSNFKVHEDDANNALKKIIDDIDWKKSRGVLFLDPYGMSVDWSTLERIASTKSLDVWYLFPLSATYRQAANRLEKIDEHKATKLDAILGTVDWRSTFYAESAQENLFDSGKTAIRVANPRDIATFVWERLAKVFQGWVSEPILLPENGPPMFALFFASSNPSSAAIKLSKRAAEHLFEMLKNNKIGKKKLLDELRTQNDFFE